LWSPAYILPGVLFGASLGVAAEIAGHLALLLALLVGLLWFSWWLMRRLTRSLQPHAQALQLAVLDRSRPYRWLHPLAASLLDPRHPEARGMTVLTVLLVIASWLLLTLLPGRLSPDSWLGNLDLYLHYQLTSLRGPLGDQLMVFVTGLGSAWVLYGFTALTSLWLLWRGHWRMTVHWLIVVGAVSLMTELLKHYTGVPRPPALETTALGYAFPSAHAGRSIAVYGFLAVAIARELRSNWHWLPYSSAVFLVVAISFSRLYLGAHWFSDVLGGWSLGVAWVALMGIAYRQHPAEKISARILAPVALAALVLTTGVFTSQQFDRQMALYKLQPAAEITLTRGDWLKQGWESLPVYRDDFIGHHNHPLDIQWLATREQIENHLQARGWRRPHTAGSVSLLDLFNSDSGLGQLPVLPQVHRGETQQILLVQTGDNSGHLLTLRLWSTGYHLTDSEKKLWIGNVSYLTVDERFRVVHFLHTDPDYRGALQAFAPALAGLDTRRVQRPASALQPSMSIWTGSVLLIGGD
jgi:undecaprenyl-diphosphatase